MYLEEIHRTHWSQGSTLLVHGPVVQSAEGNAADKQGFKGAVAPSARSAGPRQSTVIPVGNVYRVIHRNDMPLDDTYSRG